MASAAVVVHLQFGAVDLVNDGRTLLVYVDMQCLPCGLASKSSVHVTLAHHAIGISSEAVGLVRVWVDCLCTAGRVAWLVRWGRGARSALIDGPFLLEVQRLRCELELFNERPLHMELHD